MVTDPNEIVKRYVSVWNEPDADRRRDDVAEIWAKDGAYVTQEAETVGHEAITGTIAKTYEQFVASGFTFRSQDNVVSHHGVVRFSWDMVPTSGGDAVSVGTEFFVLDKDGRIERDIQFIER